MPACWHRARTTPSQRWCMGKVAYEASYRGEWRPLCPVHVDDYRRDCAIRQISTGRVTRPVRETAK